MFNKINQSLLCIPVMYGHIAILILIMLICGLFGGYLNYVNNFDTTEPDENDKAKRSKYILLGIGASLIMPLMLNTIQSNLINFEESFKPGNYLIFAGFCLIAAIFSRRFITTIGEKILESAKKAERTAKENAQKIELAQKELSSTNERIEDVKLAVDLKNTVNQNIVSQDGKWFEQLVELANSYVQRTSIPDYSERIAVKSEFGRKMAELIVRNNFSVKDLFSQYPSEGMYVAIAYSILLRPNKESLSMLNKLSKVVMSLFAKARILDAYKTLARNSFITKDQAKDIYSTILKFREKADMPLIKNLDGTVNVLKTIDPTIDS
jgi:hypothetical protein